MAVSPTGGSVTPTSMTLGDLAGLSSLLGASSTGAAKTNPWLAGAAVAVPALTALYGTWQSGRVASKGLLSQERMMREQMAMQERILADQAKAQEKYYEEQKRQYEMQQELERQRFERQQGLLERQYDEKKAMARPYYDYVWNYLNTPVK